MVRMAERPADEAASSASAPAAAETAPSEAPLPADSTGLTASAAGSASAASPETAPSENGDYRRVKVFYGTDRAPLGPGTAATGSFSVWHFLPALLAAAAAVVAGVFACRVRARRVPLGILAGAMSIFALAFAAVELSSLPCGCGPIRAYGNDRGSLEVGVCEVTIPNSHREGMLETPSILRLELREDASKHIVLRSVAVREHDEFIRELKASVAQSPEREALVFIHGYNVSFEDAARRTAQMAVDLHVRGAPIFYSWPSQGGLFEYTVDETNVVWTVPHLKQFLLEVARQSDARSINVIAHSMGNRALASALRELAFELRDEKLQLNQVVLAAPDIDAEVFRRDVAPAITSTAHGVTLYASSKDRALAASKQVHGYPRAGDSRPSLLLLPGIDTIDVSDVDTSLLGHSYYGSCRQILDDISVLIHHGLPAASRGELVAGTRGEQTYWTFRTASASDGAGSAAHDTLR